MGRQTYRQVITSPEIWEKVNSENKNLMTKFLKEKNTRSSDTTVLGYESDLKIFFTYNHLENSDKHFTEIRKLEFADFFSYCVQDLKWGSARFSRMRSVLSSFSQFLEKFYDDSFPNFRNIILKSIESMPKVEVREKTILSEKQCEDLLYYLSETLDDSQTACILALALASGSRFSELLRFTTDILDENHTSFNDIFMETTSKIKTKGRTRTGKLLSKYIIKEIFLPYYKKWLIDREKIMKENNKEHNFLFIKIDGSPAVSGTIRSMVPKMTKFLGVPFYFHSCRHYFTTFLSKKGLPSALIQEIVGWSSISMISIYDDTSVKDKTWTELESMKPKEITEEIQ